MEGESLRMEIRVRPPRHSWGDCCARPTTACSANSKTLEGEQHPDCDAQLQHIHDTVATFLAAGTPVVSVDCKNRELVGRYRNNGKEYRPAGDPEKVEVHDLIGEGGKAIPYGVYELGANTGVSVGTDLRDCRVRREHPTHLVEHLWPPHLPRCRPTDDHRGQRWRQRQPAAHVEDQLAALAECCSASTAPTRRTRASRSGKIPSTSVRVSDTCSRGRALPVTRR